jgi:predicted GNAT family N-acyltransferase
LSADCRLTLTVREARDDADVAAAQRLRVQVFCDEQGVSREEELDEFEGSAIHVVAFDESGVVATCRLREVEGGTKLERMAVVRRLRGLGAGARLLIEAEAIARERGSKRMILHAQTRAQGFYGGQGYEPEGARFDEAGIEHVRMTKAL